MEAVYTNLVLGWAGFRHEIQQRSIVVGEKSPECCRIRPCRSQCVKYMLMWEYNTMRNVNTLNEHTTDLAFLMSVPRYDIHEKLNRTRMHHRLGLFDCPLQ